VFWGLQPLVHGPATGGGEAAVMKMSIVMLFVLAGYMICATTAVGIILGLPLP
jgi:hypothetical protein